VQDLEPWHLVPLDGILKSKMRARAGGINRGGGVPGRAAGI